MLVRDVMSLNPITVGEEMSVIEAAELMKRNRVRRFPVTRNDELIGMVTDRDIRSAGPSGVISFDEAERKLLPDLYELLAKIRIKDIMVRNVIVISPEKTIVTASLMMLKHKISGLPVVDDQRRLLGVLTRGDIIKSFVDISASGLGKVLFCFRLEDRPGIIAEVSGVIRTHGGRVASIMSSPMGGEDKLFRYVYIRLMDKPAVDLKAVKNDLGKKYEVLFIIEDDVTIP